VYAPETAREETVEQINGNPWEDNAFLIFSKKKEGEAIIPGVGGEMASGGENANVGRSKIELENYLDRESLLVRGTWLNHLASNRAGLLQQRLVIEDNIGGANQILWNIESRREIRVVGGVLLATRPQKMKR
jgi:hypothetical protein